MSLRYFYKSMFFRTLAEDLITPFISIFALSLGATTTLIGLVTSLPNFASLLSQLIWGSIAENMKNKKFLVILGGLLWAFMWLPIALVQNTYQLIILLTIQAFLSSISIPASTVLLIRLTQPYKRSIATGNLNSISGVGSFIGSIVAGYILNAYGFIYFIFVLVFIFGLTSRIVFFKVKEPPEVVSRKTLKEILKSSYDITPFKKNKKLFRFTIAVMAVNLTTALTGGFFAVYVITGLKGSLLDVAIIGAIGTVSEIIFFRAWGLIGDSMNKKTIMMTTMIPISFIPLVYVVAQNVYWIYAYAIIARMSWSGFNLAVFAYMSDAISKEKISSNVTFFNLFTGLATSIGPLIGGVMADFMQKDFLINGLTSLFILSAVLRFSSMIFVGRLEKSGSSKMSLLKFGLYPMGVMQGFETFLKTYTIVVKVAKKESFKMINHFNFLKWIRK